LSEVPLLSIGIPLYRAAAFYDTIVDNIDSIDYANVEILISDRHLIDDTIDRLETRYQDDKRVTAYRHEDEGDWWDNYNFLLTRASGKYFRWLPQDDPLPRVGLDKLIARMEAEPQAILVYPRIDTIGPSGEVLVEGGHDVRHAAKKCRRWRYRDALSVAAQIHHQAAGTGIIRREQVVGLNIRIPEVGGGLGTMAFRYGLALHGRFVMVTDVVGYYRWHSGNYSHYTRRRFGDYWSYFKAARSYDPSDLSRLARLGRDVALIGAAFVIAPAVRLVWNWTPKGRLARRTMRSA